MVYKLARHFCTQAEIADILEISRVTLHKDKQFLNNYNLGKAKAKKSLRSAQYKYALKGNAKLLIWLGKNYLYQKDTPVENPSDNINDKLSAIAEAISKKDTKIADKS